MLSILWLISKFQLLSLFYGVAALAYQLEISSDWTQAEVELPRSDSNMAVYSHNDSIFIIGGSNNPMQMTEYDVLTENITDLGSNVLLTNTYGSGQFYSQNQDAFYMVWDNNLFILDLHTNILNQPWRNESVSIDVNRAACVESSDKYIYIVGGGTISVPLNNFQIFAIFENQWKHDAPSMQSARASLSCILHHDTDTLYAIGGHNLNSIEKISAQSNASNISAFYSVNSWKYIDNLLYTTSQSRAITHDNLIIVIGGVEESSFVYSSVIQVINPTDGTVTLGGNLNYPVAGAAIIHMYDVLYVFGGIKQVNIDCYLDQLDYFNKRTLEYGAYGNGFTLSTCSEKCSNYTNVVLQSLPLIDSLPDSSFSASSYGGQSITGWGGPRNAKKNGGWDGAWCAKTSNANQWLKIDLGGIRRIKSVSTFGRRSTSPPDPPEQHWVTSYKFAYSANDSSIFTLYNNSEILTGNIDRLTEVNHILNEEINARYLKFMPVTWQGGVNMRVEVYGGCWYLTSHCNNSCYIADTTLASRQLYKKVSTKYFQYSSLTASPTESPTTNPTNYPTKDTTVSPTYAPSYSPTACIDYLNYTSIDGIDVIELVTSDKQINYTSYSYGHMVVSWYIGKDTTTFYDELISCNENSHVDVCFVGCYMSGVCADTIIKPVTYVQELQIICAAKKACRNIVVNITDVNIDKVNILCWNKFSCDGGIISVNTLFPIEMNVECNETFSCQDLSFVLMNEQGLYTINISCIDDNACKNMMINTHDSKNIFITLNAFRYSEDIFIDHQHLKNIKITCGWSHDRRYIRYDTHELLDPSEILQLARNEYNINKLPCEDIYVECSGNNTDFQQQCKFKYQLSATVNLISILNDSNRADCYWIEIGQLYEAFCDGTCGDKFQYNEHNQSFNLDLEFYNRNTTKSFDICNEYFGTFNDTTDSLSSIDAVFYYTLSIIASDPNSLIHDVINNPETILRDGLLKVGCQNKKQNTIKITTDVTIESAEIDTKVIDALFSKGSQFIETSEKLLSKLFGIPVTFENVEKTSVNIMNGIEQWVVWLIIFSTICIISIIIICVIRNWKKRKAQLEELTMYIRNPLVLAFCIGVYEKNPDNPQIDGYFEDLEGIDIDIKNIIALFANTLNYKVVPSYDINKFIKQEWKLQEIKDLLDKYSNYLEKNIDVYDGLVVIVSC
eukprot:459365_1